MEKYENPAFSPEERADDLLGKLSLEEKMAQTVCIYPMGLIMRRDSSEMYREACRNGMGSISCMEMRDLTDPKAVAEYQRKMQTMVIEQSSHHIPAIFHMEGVCGGMIAGNTSFPANIGRGSGWDPALEKEIGEIVSRQEKCFGISQILAPVLDVSRDSRMGRQAESYSEDPALAAALGSAFTKGIQGQTRSDGLRADAVAKHFAGFHNSQGGIHGADSLTPPRLMEEIYCKPFQAAITEAGLRGVMPCYCTINGEAASTSYSLLTELLRHRLGFDGLAVSDYTGIANAYNEQGLYESLADAGLHAMQAGMDMEWPKKEAYNDELMGWFADGTADVEILNTVVRRILTAKFRMGLFEHPFALPDDVRADEFQHAEDKAVSKRTAAQSFVLLKNNGVLPISKSVKKIAVVGPHADRARYLFGGYTHISMKESVCAMACSIAGIDENGGYITKDYPKYPGTQVQIDDAPIFEQITDAIKPSCSSLLEALRASLPDCEITYTRGYPIAGTDESGYAEALAAVQDADLCLLTLGGRYSSSSVSTMGEGVDSTDINLPICQEHFIREAAKLGTPLVGLHFDGRPASSDAADELLDALVEAWVPAEMGGEALADMLTGKVNFSGKLPVSVAYNAGQEPIYYNHPNGSAWHQGASIGFPEYVNCPHTPRYPFGFGLSYTTFAYDDLQLDRREVEPDGTVNISVRVTNTGSVAGTEVVQLYLRDPHASMVRPNMELQGFARVALKPGESKTVTFAIAPSQTAFLNSKNEWLIEKGEIEVLVGRSSADICCRDAFTITESAVIDGRTRRFYSIGQV